MNVKEEEEEEEEKRRLKFLVFYASLAGNKNVFLLFPHLC